MATRIRTFINVDTSSTIGATMTTVKTQLTACGERITRMLSDPQVDMDDREAGFKALERLTKIINSFKDW